MPNLRPDLIYRTATISNPTSSMGTSMQPLSTDLGIISQSELIVCSTPISMS